MQESARHFLNRLRDDSNFYLEVGSAPSKAQRWQVINQHGFRFDEAELALAKAELSASTKQDLDIVHVHSHGIAEMGDVERIVTSDRCGTCE